MINQSKFLSTNTFRLKRWALMGATFVAFVVTELAIGTEIFLDRPYLAGLLALPIIVVVGAYFMARLEYGILILLFLMIWFSRTGISTGTGSDLTVSLLFSILLAILWFVRMALDGNIRIVRSAINIPVLAFSSVVILSMLWCRFFLDPQVIIPSTFIRVQAGTVAVTIISALVPILCINLIKRVQLVRICYWLLLSGSLFYVVNYIFEFTKIGGGIATERVADQDQITLDSLSRAVNAGGLLPLWICCLTVGLLFNARDLSKWQRFWMYLCLSGWLYRLFVITLVRISGWLPTLIGLLIILFIFSRKWFFILSAVAVLLIVLNWGKVYDATVVQKQNEGTLSGATSRESLWSQAFLVAKNQIILGTGPAGYANYYLTYYRDHALSTHNNYLDMVLQYGATGLIVFCWLCFVMVKELWKAYRLQPARTFEKGFTIGAFAGACGMLPGMILGDWVIPFAYNQTIGGYAYTVYNWLFIGLGLALGCIAQEKQKTTALQLPE